MTSENKSKDKEKTIWSAREIWALQFLGSILLVIGIFYILLKEPTTGATALVGGLLLLALSKPEIISSIEGFGFKLSLIKKDIEETIKIAESQIAQMRKVAIEFNRQQFKLQANAKRPESIEEKKARRKTYNEFQERFRELGCTEDEIQQFSSDWRKETIRQWENDQYLKSFEAPINAAGQLNFSLGIVKEYVDGKKQSDAPLPQGLSKDLILKYEKIEWAMDQKNPWEYLFEVFEKVKTDFTEFNDYPPVKELLRFISVHEEIGKRPVPPLELPEEWPNP